MIQINQMQFSYKKDASLFEDLDVKMQAGKIHGLLGKNGAGKTTLLKLIAGLQYPQLGTISIDNENAKGRNPSYLSKYFFVAEEFEMPNILLSTYVDLYAPFYKDFDKKQLDIYLEEFAIPKENKLNKMSYGQKKKFLISFGLATNTKVLIMDEPTNGLDIPSKSIFRKMIAQQINEDRLFIISTHQIKDIEGMIDTVIVLENGKVLFNEEMLNISKQLVFKDAETAIGNENILFSQDVLGGKRLICKNTEAEDSRIDVELLFNAIVSDNETIINVFNQ
jgi:ABC-2 type transport system ATP-binding protein